MKNKRDLWCLKILGTEAQVKDTVISLTYKNEHVYVHVNVHSRNLLSSLINQTNWWEKNELHYHEQKLVIKVIYKTRTFPGNCMKITAFVKLRYIAHLKNVKEKNVNKKINKNENLLIF